jgi:hypothetical protein
MEVRIASGRYMLLIHSFIVFYRQFRCLHCCRRTFPPAWRACLGTCCRSFFSSLCTPGTLERTMPLIWSMKHLLSMSWMVAAAGSPLDWWSGAPSSSACFFL